MVLQDLGNKITGALAKLNTVTVIDEDVIDAILKDICGALMHSDVNVKTVAEMRKNMKKACSAENIPPGANRTKQIRNAVFNELVRLLTPTTEAFVPKKGKCNVFMFVGLQGSGKTTTIGKFANYWSRKGWKTAMVCCDTFRAGALDQIKQNALKLHIPYFGDPLQADPVKLAEEGTRHFREENYDIILVDTSGRHRQEADLFDEMIQVQQVVNPDEVIFVMDSTIGQAVAEQATAFKEAVPVGAVIVTKLDGHAKGGGALSAVAATDAPITFIGTGEHFDEFEKFEADSFVRRLLGMGDVKGLMEKMKDSKMFDSPQLLERMQKGQFTLRDMRQQLEQLLGMGSMSQVMSMIPGMSQMLQGMGGNPQDATKKLQTFMTCMDSMTNDELDCIFKSRQPDPKNPGSFIITYEKTMNESRIKRIARGAGVPPDFVVLLLGMQKQFATMVGKMGKGGFSKAGQAKQMQQMQRNPGQMMQHLSKAMDPRLLQQMGGAENVMNMMKQFQSADPQGLAAMMGGMGGAPGAGRGTGRKKR